MFYDYVDGGSWTESTYRANEEALARVRLRQRVGRNVADRSTAATLLGEPSTMPLALSPTGLAGMLYANGEIIAARAAFKAGVPFILSTMSICSIEDVAEHSGAPFWFQLYVMRDRDFVCDLIERARAAGCPALVLTLDLQVQGQRHKDIRNGLATPLRLTLANAIRLAAKPAWCVNMASTRRRHFGNIIGHARNVSDLPSLSTWTAQQFEPGLSWDDVAWVKQRWRGKLVVKGVLDAEDARHAVDAGADALIVSNHGGRQLDGALASIEALADVVDKVGHRTEVHMDGGIRSGQDIARALAFGAKAVHIGRPYLYGLGAAGEKGVLTCLQILAKELDLTMAFCGVRRTDEIDRSLLAFPKL
jgi:L-lactate dehydrogenase (cytochrome)